MKKRSQMQGATRVCSLTIREGERGRGGVAGREVRSSGRRKLALGNIDGPCERLQEGAVDALAR